MTRRILICIVCTILLVAGLFIIYKADNNEIVNTHDNIQSKYPNQKVYTKVLSDGTEILVIEPKKEEPEETIELPLHIQYFENQKSHNDWVKFNYLSENLHNLNTEIQIPFEINEIDLYELYSLITRTQLDIGYLDAEINYKLQNGYVTELYPKYNYNIYDIERMQLDIQDKKAIHYMIGLNNPYLTDYEKVKYIHDTIITNCKYSESSNSNDIFGVIFTGEAVCEGYAKTFSYFCNLYNIQSVIVTGTVNNTPHMWNKVLLDGEWYNIDVTWDDLDIYKDSNISYEYFLISDEEIGATHIIDNLFEYPSANNSYNRKDDLNG